MTAPAVRPSRDDFRVLARDYTVVPVWREVLADLETPLSAFVKLVGDREGFLLESVEHAERWGRFSFLGRNPARTFIARGRNIEWLGRRAARRRSRRSGHARAGRGVARAVPCSDVAGAATVSRRHRGLDGLRHRAGDRGPPFTAARRSGLSRRGVLAGRAVWPRSTTSVSGCISSRTCTRRRGPTRARSMRCTTARSRGSTNAVVDLGQPLPYRPALPPEDELDQLPDVRAQLRARCVDRGRRRREGAHPRRRHLPSRALAALRSRRAGRAARRLPRAAAREPVAVHVLPAPPGGDGRRVVARGAGAAAQRPGHQPPDRRDAPARSQRRARSPARGGAGRASEGTRRARHARRPGAQRRRVAWCGSGPSRSRS